MKRLKMNGTIVEYGSSDVHPGQLFTNVYDGSYYLIVLEVHAGRIYYHMDDVFGPSTGHAGRLVGWKRVE